MTKFSYAIRTGLLAAGLAGLAATPFALAAETGTANPAAPAATPDASMPMHAATHHGMLSHKRVAQVQQVLATSGDKIKVDGIWGTKTEAALKQFQEQHHLKVTGRLDQATDKELQSATHGA